MKKKSKEKVTLETVVSLIETSIKAASKQIIEDLTQVIKDATSLMVTKSEFNEFKQEMVEFKKDTEGTLYNLDQHAKKTDERLTNIEKIIEPLPGMWKAAQRELRDHEKRITRLEDTPA